MLTNFSNTYKNAWPDSIVLKELKYLESNTKQKKYKLLKKKLFQILLIFISKKKNFQTKLIKKLKK